MKIYKSILASLAAAAVVLTAELLPLKLFEQQEETLFGRAYPFPNAAGKIDPQAEDIYLVETIRDIYENGYEGGNQSYETRYARLSEQFPLQLRQMNEQDILDSRLYDWMEEGYTYLGDSYMGYNGGTLNIIESVCYMENVKAMDVYHEFLFLMEERTNKLLTLRFLYNNPVILDKSAQIAIMEKYITYLDLDILGDWVYNEVGLTSQKAQLQVVCHTTQNVFLLQIVPVDFYRQNVYAFIDSWLIPY